jgi:hypothetical protein
MQSRAQKTLVASRTHSKIKSEFYTLKPVPSQKFFDAHSFLSFELNIL